MPTHVFSFRNHSLRRHHNRPHSAATRTLISGLAAAALVLSTSAGAYAASPDAPATIAADSFNRSVTGGWGTTPAGQQYQTIASASSALNVDGASATLRLAPAQAARTILSGVDAQDVRSEVSVRLPEAAGAAYYAFIMRAQTDGSEYRGRLYLNAERVPFLSVDRIEAGTETTLAAVKLDAPVDPKAWYRLAFTVTGQDPVQIEASFTKGSAASSTPQLSYSDSAKTRLASSGGVGFWGYVSSSATAPATLYLDDLAVTGSAPPLSRAGQVPAPVPEAPAVQNPAPAAPAQPQAPAQPAPAPQAAISQGGAGAAPVGSAAYAVPAGAIFVNPTAGTSGNGSQSSPFKTVRAAVNAAKSGATIVLRGGIYHEQVSIPFGKNALTIQAHPKEAVWFDGSVPVKNWSQSGAVWVSAGWTARFSSDMLNGQASRFVDPAYPNAALPDQLFIDGVSLKQVASPSAVVAGTFAVDYANKRLVLGTNPAGRDVRASDLSQAIDSLSTHTTLQGFGVRRYATQYSQMGAVRLQNVNATVRDLVVVDNAMTGISMSNNNDLAERVTVQRNGQLGMRVSQAYNFTLRDSVITHNNSERFKTAPESGGVKVTKSRGVVASKNTITDNYTNGLWFDQSNYDMTVVNNNLKNNLVNNLEVEISAKGVIAGNDMTGGATGLYLLDAGDLRVFNNTFGGNSFMSVKMYQDRRRQSVQTSDTAGQRDPRRPTVDSTVPWLMQNIALSNNIFAGGGQFAVYALDKESNRPVDSWNLVINGNIFTNHAAGGPQMVAWGLGDNKSQQKYHTPAALAAAKGSGWKNAMTSGAPKNRAGMESDVSAMQGSITVPVPADIAQLIGVAPGARVLGAPH